MQFISDACLENLSPPPYLIEHVLPAGALGLLVGETGHGKTLLALHTAYCVATGTPWLGHPVKQGTVAYIMAEGTGGLPPRVHAWKIAHGKEGPVGVFFWRQPVQLMHTQEVQKFLAALEQIPAPLALVVIDTLARCFVGGEENSAKDMGLFIAGLDRLRAATGAAVLVVHHTGRESGRERGSTALSGAVDTLMVIERHPKDGSRWLKCKKQKDDDPFKPIVFRLDEVEVDEGLTSCVVKPAESSQPPKLPGGWKKALTALAAFPDGATFTKWLQASGLKKTTFARAIHALLGCSLAQKKDGKYFQAGTGIDGQ